MSEVTTKCPECFCADVCDVDLLGHGYRECVDCGQDWWTDIDYTKPFKQAITNRPTQPDAAYMLDRRVQ